MLSRGLPRINTMMSPMNLGLHLPNPKNMLTRVNIRYVSSSSEEDQSSVARHRSSKPCGADEPRIASSKSKKHADKSKHKICVIFFRGGSVLCSQTQVF